MSTESILQFQQAFSELEKFGQVLLLDAFQRMGVFQRGDERHDKFHLRDRLKIIPGYFRLYDALLDILIRAGFIQLEGQRILTTSQIEEADLQAMLHNPDEHRNHLLAAFPGIEGHIRLLCACLASYPEVLTGRKDHMEVMFPQGSMSLVEGIYRGNRVADYYNTLMAQLVKIYIQQRLQHDPQAEIHIVELGAGTGGTSAFVLKLIDEYGQKLRYFYTDISLGFTQYGKRIFGEDYPFVEFKVLNIEEDPQRQGFKPNSADIVLASNVIHTTKRIDHTLRQIKKLLKANGLFMVNEVTQVQSFATLTFGLTSGWWLFEDEDNRLKGSPLLDLAGWKAVLEASGFRQIRALGFPGMPEESSGQNVIAGESDGCAVFENDPFGQPPGKDSRSHTDSHAESRPANQPGTGNMRKSPPLPPPFPPSIKGSEGGSLREGARDYVKTVLSRVLKVPKSQVDSQSTFEKYGVDSLVVMEINKEFEKDFGSLPPTLLFENMSVDALADYFIKKHEPVLRRKIGAGKAQLVETADSLFRSDDRLKGDEAANQIHEQESSKDIAIIGVSGRYPGAETLEDYWENLKNGRNCISEIPQDRWDWRKHYDPDPHKKDKHYSKWGGFIKDVDKFDSLFFNISPREAEVMDPQERLFLETVWATLEDAGYTRKDLDKIHRQVGVFVGVMNGDYGWFSAGAWAAGEAVGTDSSHWSHANRVSYYFNFQGPSLAVDTACSSSLTAIHLACESIKRGECQAAIAGGVNLIVHPLHYVKLCKMNMLAGDDRCKSFGSGADGFVDGEGVGAVLLKPLEMAIRDGDHIYAVIKGSFINSGGKTSGYTVPNPNAQATLISKALERAGVNPRTISYLEAHGTGTSLGDPIEIAGLVKAFEEHTGEGHAQDRQYCSLGSVKSNIGHLESAAGIAGLTKVLLQMKHKQLVPSINSEELNPHINFDGTPFYLQRELAEWKQPVIGQQGEEKRYPRRAGISSFGAGGAYAHIILEEFDALPPASDSAGPEQQIPEQHVIMLSAKNDERLKVYAQRILGYLERQRAEEKSQDSQDRMKLAEIAYTLQVGREAMEERLALIVSSMDELIQKLAQYCQGAEDKEDLYQGNVKKDKTRAELLLDGRAGEEFLKTTLCNRQLGKLARLWVSGVDVEWGLLYPNARPRRISLPAYPFARERHWVTVRDVISPARAYTSQGQVAVGQVSGL
ncbi:MAG: beta-ketoacyl synthase N-terminal-like domain-containing protein, partial [bacterium]